ncbi:MAG: glycosyltransferase family A protein [Thermoanaerobaculia bacterium]
MSDRPGVSVIVPFFNSERTLAACIDSLLDQFEVEDGYEIILVNNRSTDGSPSIAARYSEITTLEEEAVGAYSARNTGVGRARAPIIAFTDADCVVSRDWLRSIDEGMSDAAVAILLGHCRYPPQGSLSLRLLGAYENAKADYVIRRCGAVYHFGYANNMAVKASVFEELGPFEPWRRGADSELVHRLEANRPDLRLEFRPSMRVTHLEFIQTRERFRRMALYTRTNSQIGSFRELGPIQRLGVLSQLLRRLPVYL